MRDPYLSKRSIKRFIREKIEKYKLLTALSLSTKTWCTLLLSIFKVATTSCAGTEFQQHLQKVMPFSIFYLFVAPDASTGSRQASSTMPTPIMFMCKVGAGCSGTLRGCGGNSNCQDLNSNHRDGALLRTNWLSLPEWKAQSRPTAACIPPCRARDRDGKRNTSLDCNN